MIDPIAFQIGPLAVRWYALCIVSGLVLAVYLASKEAPKKKILSDDILDFILIAFPLSIIGARLYYVIFRFDYYSQHLESHSLHPYLSAHNAHYFQAKWHLYLDFLWY